MFHNYPYNDFHEMNLDWFLNKFKELQAEWNALSGNIREWLEETLQGWLDDGTIASYLNNIVIVNDYGAKGDGVTDDTEAIQRCFDQNPNSVVVFKKGNYLISDTLSLYGNQGGQLILVGGSTITWDGDRDASKFMIDVNKNTGDESRCIIKGGTFNGMDRIGGGLRAAQYYTTFDGCRVLDVTKEAITIGYDYTGQISLVRSLQCVINNCYVIMSSDSIQGWSDVNNVRGIALYASDNTISNCNTNRTKIGIYWKSAGHVVTNCHFTAQYKSPLVDVANTYGIYLDPYSTTSINSELVANCYFDNHKYCIYGATDTRKTFTVSGCKYFWSGRQATGIVDCYMNGGHFINMDINDFTVVPVGGKCRFYDASFVSNLTYQAKAILKHQHYNQTIYTLLDEAFVPYTANHLRDNGETVEVYRDTAITSSDYIMIGCLLFNEDDDERGRTPSAKFKLYNRVYGDYDFTIHWSAVGVPSVVEKRIFTPSTDLHFIVGEMTGITIAGTRWQYVPLYLHGAAEASTQYGLIDMYVETGTNGAIYLLNDKTFIETGVTVGLDVDLSETRQLYYYPAILNIHGSTMRVNTDYGGISIGSTSSDESVILRTNDETDKTLTLGNNAKGLNRIYLGRNVDWIDYNNLAALHGRAISNNATFNGCIPARSNCCEFMIIKISSDILIKCYADASSNNIISEGTIPAGIVITKDNKNISITNTTGAVIYVVGLGVATE